MAWTKADARRDARMARRAAQRAEALLSTFSGEHTRMERERAIAGLRHEVATILGFLAWAGDGDPSTGPPARGEVAQAPLFTEL